MKNLAGLMKQASQMQAKMQEMQAKLESLELTGEAGGSRIQREDTVGVGGGQRGEPGRRRRQHRGGDGELGRQPDYAEPGSNPFLPVPANPIGRNRNAGRTPSTAGPTLRISLTLYAADGVGLAAPQVGILQRLVVIDLGTERPDGKRDYAKPIG